MGEIARDYWNRRPVSREVLALAEVSWSGTAAPAEGSFAATGTRRGLAPAPTHCRRGICRKHLNDDMASDIFVSMKTVTKRQLVRNPALVSHLKPGESLAIEDGETPLVVSRPKRDQLTADQIEAEIQLICKDAPTLDCQEVLNDLRQ